MQNRKRITALTQAPLARPEHALGGGAEACESIVAAGFVAAAVVRVAEGDSAEVITSAGGLDADTAAIVASAAGEAARTGRPVHGGAAAPTGECHVAAAVCGADEQGLLVIAAVDSHITTHEAQALAVWASPASAEGDVAGGGACGELARTVAQQHAADVVVVALFSGSAMSLDLHTRSGTLVRSWRCTSDTVWAEAAKHSSAYVLGSLEHHSGAEWMAALGLESAAVVGLANSDGDAVGAIGVGSFGHLAVDVASQLLDYAPLLGRQVAAAKTDLAPLAAQPAPADEQQVKISSFAQAVGCERMAVYTRVGPLQFALAAAHGTDGTAVDMEPDPVEEQLVQIMSDDGTAMVYEDAALVCLGDDTILYARDANKNALECVRRALRDLRTGFRRAA